MPPLRAPTPQLCWRSWTAAPQGAMSLWGWRNTEDSPHSALVGVQLPPCRDCRPEVAECTAQPEAIPVASLFWDLTCCGQLGSTSQLMVTSCPGKVGWQRGWTATSCTVNVWGIKCQGRELRVGGRQIKSPMLSVSMVPRGSGELGITAKCKCIVCRVHSEQGARLCWWPLGFVWSDPYFWSRLISLLQYRWGN